MTEGLFPMKSFFCTPIFLFLAVGLSAQSVSQKGTVIVIGHSDDKIVVAADSRETEGDGKFKDDACKLIEFDDHTIFTGAGSAVHATNGVVYWNSYLEGQEAFKRAKQSAQPNILSNAATDLREHLTNAVNQALLSDPIGSMNEVEGGRTIYNAQFLGFDNGKGTMFQVEIFLDPKTKKAHYQVDAVHNDKRGMIIDAGGWNEIPFEVVRNETPFAIEEQKKWAKMVNTFPVQDREARWAIRLVELSEAYGKHKIYMGGPVDAAEITANGIRWIQRKRGCEYGGLTVKKDEAR